MTLDSVLKKSKMYELGLAHAFMARNIGDFHQAALKHYGLSQIEWLVMGAVAHATKQGGIRVTDLATAFDVKSTYITSILNGLRGKDYIETRLDASDARVRRAILTKKSAKEMPAIERHILKLAVQELQDVITPEELEAYLGVVLKLGRSLHKS